MSQYSRPPLVRDPYSPAVAAPVQSATGYVAPAPVSVYAQEEQYSPTVSSLAGVHVSTPHCLRTLLCCGYV